LVFSIALHSSFNLSIDIILGSFVLVTLLLCIPEHGINSIELTIILPIVSNFWGTFVLQIFILFNWDLLILKGSRIRCYLLDIRNTKNGSFLGVLATTFI